MEQDENKPVSPTGVNYGGTTTTETFGNAGPVRVTKKVISADPHLKVITPRMNYQTGYGDKWYVMQKGVQLAVPQDAAERFVEAGVAEWA